MTLKYDINMKVVSQFIGWICKLSWWDIVQK